MRTKPQYEADILGISAIIGIILFGIHLSLGWWTIVPVLVFIALGNAIKETGTAFRMPW